MVRRHELTNAQWERIAPLLPEIGGPGGRWADHRTVVNGVFYRTRTGIPSPRARRGGDVFRVPLEARIGREIARSHLVGPVRAPERVHRAEWERRAAALMPRSQLFIDGVFVDAASGRTFLCGLEQHN